MFMFCTGLQCRKLGGAVHALLKRPTRQMEWNLSYRVLTVLTQREDLDE